MYNFHPLDLLPNDQKPLTNLLIKLAGTEDNMLNTLERQVGGNHYKQFAIEPMEFIGRNKINFIEGDIIKRICRYKFIDNPMEDLDKIVHEIEVLKEIYTIDKKALEEVLLDE